MVCNNLPCPICREHASTYIRTHKIQVKTKEEFKLYLYEFHNYVNIKTRKTRASIDILKKYERSIFRKIILCFFQNFKGKKYNNLDFVENMSRDSMLYKLKNWLNINMGQFS